MYVVGQAHWAQPIRVLWRLMPLAVFGIWNMQWRQIDE